MSLELTKRRIQGILALPDGTKLKGVKISCNARRDLGADGTLIPGGGVVNTVTGKTDLDAGQYDFWLYTYVGSFVNYRCVIENLRANKFTLEPGGIISLDDLFDLQYVDDVPSGIVALQTLITQHEAELDPHPQYLTQAEGDARYSIGGSGGAVASINGQTGAVVLNKSDVGLAFVNNTADSAKPVSTAQAAADAAARDAAIAAVRGGVISAGDSLAKLYALISSGGSGTASKLTVVDYDEAPETGDVGEVVFLTKDGGDSASLYLRTAPDVLSEVPVSQGDAQPYQVQRRNADDTAFETAFIIRDLCFAMTREDVPIAEGDSYSFYIYRNFKILEVCLELSTPQTSGALIELDLRRNTTHVFSTNLTVDNGEETNITAATAPILSITDLIRGNKMTAEIITIGDGTAKGARLHVIGYDME